MALPLTLIDTGASGDTLLEGMVKVNQTIDHLNSGFFQTASNITAGILPEARIGAVDFAKVYGTSAVPLTIEANSSGFLLRLTSASTTPGDKVELRITQGSIYLSTIGLALNSTSYLNSGAGESDLVIATKSNSAGYSNAIRFCTPSDDVQNIITRLLIAKDGSMTYSGPSISFGSRVGQLINLYGVAYAIGIQSSTMFFRTTDYFSFHKGGGFSVNARDPGTGGTELACINDTGIHLLAGSWFRTYGDTGWYNTTYAGGLHMTDSVFVRTYNGKALLVSRTWDNNGNIYLESNAPSIVMFDTDNNRKWLFHCNSDQIFFYRANTAGPAAIDWVNKFTVSSTGDMWLGILNNWISAYLNQALLTTSQPTFGRMICGNTQNPNFDVSDGSGCIEARTADALGSANIVFNRPGAFASKFGINTANQFEWGGWSMASARMILDASGNLSIPGNLTCNNITLTGGTMAAVKSVRRYSFASNTTSTETSVPIGATVDPNKSVIILTSLISEGGYLSTGVRLSDSTTMLVRNYNTSITLYWQLVEYY